MRRIATDLRPGYVALVLSAVAAVAAVAVRGLSVFADTEYGAGVGTAAVSLLLAVAVLLGVYGAYSLIIDWAASGVDRRRRQGFVNAVRLTASVVALLGVLAVVTERWLGLVVSFGIVGVAVTFALQQPLFSLIAWVYITTKEPFRPGDRVSIDGSKGDVVEVDLFVTKLWEMNGELVASDQPSGRLITVPNSAVLSSHVFNYTWKKFPYVWNELTVQVAYETDLSYATETMARVADEHLGDEMEDRVERYRALADESPVEIEVRERPSVNVRFEESWVELRLRYLVHPREGQRVRNELYQKIHEEFNDAPDSVGFPEGRSR